MDVLSSQANFGWISSSYRVMLQNLTKRYPMMMTAAGTITPAKVLVIGAGVAGSSSNSHSKKIGVE